MKRYRELRHLRPFYTSRNRMFRGANTGRGSNGDGYGDGDGYGATMLKH